MKLWNSPIFLRMRFEKSLVGEYGSSAAHFPTPQYGLVFLLVVCCLVVGIVGNTHSK